MKRLEVLALLAVVAVPSQAAVFGFEGETNLDWRTTMTLIDSGIEAVFTTNFEFAITQPFGGPTAWGTKALLTDYLHPTIMTVSFSVPIVYASIQLGDFNADRDVLSFAAFSGTDGTGLLGGDSGILENEDDISADPPVYRTLTVTATDANPIRSVQFWAVDPWGNNSVYADNLTVLPASVGAVPEPFTMGLAALGLAVSLKRRRK